MGSITPYNKYFKQPGALFLILPGCWGDSRAPPKKNMLKKHLEVLRLIQSFQWDQIFQGQLLMFCYGSKTLDGHMVP